MTTAGDAVQQYVRWRKDVADHDAAAASELPQYPLRGEPGTGGVGEAAEAAGHPTPRQRHPAGHPARPAAPLSDPGVLRDLQKVLAG